MTDVSNNMDMSQKYSAEWKKPDMEAFRWFYFIFTHTILILIW